MLQSALDLGFAAPALPPYLQPKQRDRLFFGVLLDSYAALRVSRCGHEFCQENHVIGKPRGKHLLHIALHHLGDHRHVPERTIFAAKRAAETLSLPAFEVSLNALATVSQGPSGRQALVFPAEGAGLVALHHGLGGTLRRVGLRATEHFRPHVAFLHGPYAMAQRSIEPIRFMVREFALIHSDAGLSKHNVIGRWSLNETGLRPSTALGARSLAKEAAGRLIHRKETLDANFLDGDVLWCAERRNGGEEVQRGLGFAHMDGQQRQGRILNRRGMRQLEQSLVGEKARQQRR
jgi:2'-5' RNA ligase